MGEFSASPPPLFSDPPSIFFSLIPQIMIASITLSQKFTPHFKILDPCRYSVVGLDTETKLRTHSIDRSHNRGRRP